MKASCLDKEGGGPGLSVIHFQPFNLSPLLSPPSLLKSNLVLHLQSQPCDAGVSAALIPQHGLPTISIGVRSRGPGLCTYEDVTLFTTDAFWYTMKQIKTCAPLPQETLQTSFICTSNGSSASWTTCRSDTNNFPYV